MTNGMHHGVGIIIHNPGQELFYLQDKMGTYPIPEFRNHLSFFGGKRDPGETTIDTLERELNEEWDDPILRKMVPDLARKLGTFDVCANTKSFGEVQYKLTLYHACLPNDSFERLMRQEVFEGEAVVVRKDKLMHQNYIWGLKSPLHYLPENHS